MRLTRGLGSIVVAFALVILYSTMGFTPTAAADETDTPSCGEGLDVTYTELEGSEKNKVVAEALSNEGVKELKQQLLDEGYTPQVNGSRAVRAEVIVEGFTGELLAATIPFISSDESAPPREIIFVYDPESGESIEAIQSIAFVGNCWWPCLLCGLGAAGCVLCALLCVTPAAPLCIICLLTACPGAACACNVCCTCIAGVGCNYGPCAVACVAALCYYPCC